MAQGMWTKRFTTQGEVFYFNATLNRSEWQAPVSGVIHEAEKLQIPSKDAVVAQAADTDTDEDRKRWGHAPDVNLVIIPCPSVH